MRRCLPNSGLTLLLLLPLAAQKEDPVRKWTDEEKIEVIRGLMAERATVKVYLPRSKKPLKVKPDGTYDKTEWQEVGREYGPVVRTGDQIQITKVDVEDDKLVLQINGGLNVKGKWYERIEAGAGTGGGMVPVTRNQTRSAGTAIASSFAARCADEACGIQETPCADSRLRKAERNRELLRQPAAEIQEAIKSKKVVVGMDKEQVKMAVGNPRTGSGRPRTATRRKTGSMVCRPARSPSSPSPVTR